MDFLLTILVASLVGLVFDKQKVPGGAMVGAIVGVLILNMFTDNTYMPYGAKFIAQVTAGVFIGAGIGKKELNGFKRLAKPMIILVVGMFTVNMIMGTVITMVSDLDIVTAMFCAIPGGMSYTPIIADEFGADSVSVSILQFVRMCVGISCFPSIIAYLGRNEECVNKGPIEVSKTPYSHKGFIIAILVGTIGGFLGGKSAIPAGIMLFSLIATITARQFIPSLMLPTWVRKMAQVLAGAYITAGVSLKDILSQGGLIPSIIVLIIGYLIACITIGMLLKKYCGFTLKEGMLTATPAGASDMALIASDINVFMPDIVILQIGRLLCTVMIFPNIIMLLFG